jgi:hypothetical protein
MENIFPDSLIDILLAGVALSSIIMIMLQNIKSAKIIQTGNQIWVLNLILSFVLGIPFAMKFYSLPLIDGIWVGIFSFIGAPAIYEALQNQNIINYKPSSLSSTIEISKENEIKRQ